MTVFERIAAGLPVNVKPLAKQMGVGPDTLYRAIKRQEIPGIRIGVRVTVPAYAARRLLASAKPPSDDDAP